ncbi:hypothetical protein [Solidesulfovibrio alcoholivorans]|uniref:hypothetical protein n=1 Tax=Solidesulfovibrio alcoholivorans TaxID=81406 RepID=UPI0012EB643C|nr:hypothetical protein [Solidesulfovibrio alcoholivorans]
MSKKTSMSEQPSGAKNTAQKEIPRKLKQETGRSENPDDSLNKPIGWNFRLMDQSGPWPCTFRKLTKHRQQLISYENQQYNQIFKRRGHSHTMPGDMLCKAAQKRLETIGLDKTVLLHQLDVGDAPGRLWGLVEHNIFHLLWLDPNHTVYPMKR